MRRAIKAGDMNALQAMSKDGREANKELPKGWTPLHLAAKFGRDEIAQFLLSRGAEINAETELRETPLDVAVGNEHPDFAKLLRTHGGKHASEISLHGTVLAGNLSWVKKHLSSGADIDGKSRGEFGSR